ncbi:MAG: amidohydrolase family protein [Thermodesulfobacteriota bacterium]
MGADKREIKRTLSRRTFLKQTVKAGVALTVAGSLPLSPSLRATASSDKDYDLLIKGGTVYDGTLNSPRQIDIGIKGGKITALGNLTGAAKIIDAQGLVVTPGFIDVHTHCDQAFEFMNPRFLADTFAEMKGNFNYLYQGVTTVVTGNCGLGITDTQKWRDMIKTMSFATNVFHLAPHGAIRAELFGTNQPGELTANQLEALKQRIGAEMEKGAVGVSTGLEYAPGLLASTRELIEIAKVAGRFGGIYTTHMRDESGRTLEGGRQGIMAALEEAVEVGRRSGTPVEISHFKIFAPANHLAPSRVLEVVEKARREGIDLHADQYPYDAASTTITQLIPIKFREKFYGGVKAEFKTEKGKKEIKEAIEATFTYLPPEKTLISFYPGHAELEGKTLKEIAEIKGLSPSTCYVEMVCGRICPTGIFFGMDMGQIKEFAAKDYLLTASDGYTVMKGSQRPHPRCYGTFPRKLKEFAIENKILSLPAAIRSMTSLPAEKFRIKNRGRIEKGFQADIAVIDLDNFSDKATYLEPHQYATGVRYLLVNGTIVIADGQASGGGKGFILQR